MKSAITYSFDKDEREQANGMGNALNVVKAKLRGMEVAVYMVPFLGDWLSHHFIPLHHYIHKKAKSLQPSIQLRRGLRRQLQCPRRVLLGHINLNKL